MSQLVLVLPGNLVGHSNVPGELRRKLIESFGATWLPVIDSAPVPLLLSLQAVDLQVAEVGVDSFTSTDICYAPNNHALISLMFEDPRLVSHGEWLMQNGVVGNVPVAFFPEFDVPPLEGLMLNERMVVPVWPDSEMHSNYDAGTFEARGAVNDFEALDMLGHTLVPMTGVTEGFVKPFQFWQRFPKDQDAEHALVSAIRAVAEDGADGYRFALMDLEAPIVGSHHGVSIWERFWELLVAHDLLDCFASVAEASRHWNSVAVKPEEDAATMLTRNLGPKWTGYGPQRMHMHALGGCGAGGYFHDVLAQASTSDVLSAMHSRLQNRAVPRLSADMGTLTVGHDEGVIDLGYWALQNAQLLRAKRSDPKPSCAWLAERLGLF